MNRDQLYPIMFWGSPLDPSNRNDPIAKLASLAFTALTGKRSPLDSPGACVKLEIPRERRELAARLLAGGKAIETYYGDAQCRMCGVTLGNKDLAGHGFVWPEKCEHYVLEHDVWVPALDRLIERSGN